jgi:amino acid transporter
MMATIQRFGERVSNWKCGLKTIPRAVIQSSIIAGVFFTVSAYTEVLGFHIAGQDLGTTQAPMHVLALVARVPVFGLLIDIGALVSLFAGTLACITAAAARVLLLMAHNGLAHESLRATHVRHETPIRSVIVTGTATFLPVAVLAARGASGLDVYGWIRSRLTDLLWLMYWFASRYHAICATMAFFGPGLA